MVLKGNFAVIPAGTKKEIKLKKKIIIEEKGRNIDRKKKSKYRMKKAGFYHE